ncbi:class I SAM-dependent methyltransferase [Tautonia plasticadhaerens]|uniref:Malonyl-[acyl-carrier protein] O-methyltransferase n=1 Tax=Tautonia plasticadhaerens TaxID=2527974 RepID=A0A518GYL2_9BACT|nr:class I SAM-dependent methyltransferase [Tautonia plasticadhaerens]QDV33657.1 Malonyl-[acyl-carrier protein] O-methyltransferase [Tautonia plasticadhaerens]
MTTTTTRAQSRHWSRHASNYDELFLDPFEPGVENPIVPAIGAVPDPGSKLAIDLGCGTGPLLPMLLGRFREVVAIDFAPAMVDAARQRLGPDADRVQFHVRPMDQLDDFTDRVDVAVAINSIVMPDVRDVDRTLSAIRRALRPGGVFFGVVPAIDAIQYQTMLLLDRALEQGNAPAEADRLAQQQAEHHLYDFGFGRFAFRGLRQKFWQSFELDYRLRKAGFGSVRLDQVLYPWDANLPLGEHFRGQPRSWDWAFEARP